MMRLAPALGFSLLEMLLVLVLIAAATLLAMAAFSGGLRGINLRAAANDMAAQMRFHAQWRLPADSRKTW